MSPETPDENSGPESPGPAAGPAPGTSGRRQRQRDPRRGGRRGPEEIQLLPPREITPSLRERMRRRRRDGKSVSWIASHFGVRYGDARKATARVKPRVVPKRWDAATRSFV